MSKEITLQTRREFLRTTVLGSALSWTVPAFLADTFAALVMGAWRRPGLTLAPTFGGRPLEPGTLASTPSISLTSNTGECRG